MVEKPKSSKAGTPAKKLEPWQRKAIRKVDKGKGSPEAGYALTGKEHPGLDTRRLREFMIRLCEDAWSEYGRKRPGFPETPHEMRYGRELDPDDHGQVLEQRRYVIGLLAQHHPESTIKKLVREAEENPPQTLGIAHIIHADYGREDLRDEGLELQYYMAGHRSIYPGLTERSTGKQYLAYDWRYPGEYMDIIGSPAHEEVHRLWTRFGMDTRVHDPVMAVAIEKFYRLRSGLISRDKRLVTPKPDEFDYLPETITNEALGGLETYQEPDEVYHIGNRMGQWAYKALGKDRGERYLFLRFWGKPHKEAMHISRDSRAFGQAKRRLRDRFPLTKMGEPKKRKKKKKTGLVGL